MVEVDPLETDAGQKRKRLHTVLRTCQAALLERMDPRQRWPVVGRTAS